MRSTPKPWRVEKCENGPPSSEGWPVVRIGNFWIMSAPCRGEHYVSDEEEANFIVAAANAFGQMQEKSE